MFLGIELEFLRLLEGIRTGFLDKVFEYITKLGEETIFIFLLAIIYFVIDKKYAQKLLFVVATSMGINGVVKNFAKIVRPFDVLNNPVHPVETAREAATGYSFPSGHTQTFSTWSTSLAIKLKKYWVTIIAAVLIAAVAFSRLYLGVHYPSDVIVGAALGIGCAFLLGYVYDKAPNKTTLFLIVTCALVPFAVYFLFGQDSDTADFYKMYGLLAGFTFAVMFEDKYVNFDCKQKTWKRIVALILALAIALGVKEGVKFLFNLITTPVWIDLILAWIRYFCVAFITLGLYPWVAKKIKLL